MKKPLKILLVEDNDGDVLLVQRTFKSKNELCHISVVNDGIQGMDYLFKRNGFEDADTPQVIILDLNIPKMDGKQFLQAIKEQEEFRSIPVIVLTSSQSQKDIDECYAIHASCYVVKPFDHVEFSKVLETLVNFWVNFAQLPR